MEETILNGLMTRTDFFRQAYSSLDAELFVETGTKEIFVQISEYVKKYQTQPTPKEIGLAIKESPKYNAKLKELIILTFKDVIKEHSLTNIDFLKDKTEKWIKKQRLTSTIFEAAEIIKNDGEFEPIIDKVEKALAISFDSDVGLDYNQSLEERLKYYKNKETYTSLGLKSIDDILGGGIRPASLFMYAGPSHSGKTAAKVYTAAKLALEGDNVLFVSLEMPEKEIAKRIDANLMGITIGELGVLPDEELTKKFNDIPDKIGKIVIKEYGAGTFNALHLQLLLDELKAKKDFIPDAIVIDYIGLMVSHRASKVANSYEMLGKVAEDLHALSKALYDSKSNKGVKMVTSSQLNRSAYGNLDAGMEAVSESLKIIMTADVAILLLTSDNLRENNQQVWKFVKNRYTGNLSSAMVETDFTRMMYYDFNEDSEESANANIDVGLDLSSNNDIGLDTCSFNFG